MKKSLSFVLAMLLAFSLAACDADATDAAAAPTSGAAQPTADHPGVLYGDADGDGVLTVLDATRIQRYLAGLAAIAPEQMKAAMVTDGKELSVIDATMIQRKLVGLLDAFPAEALSPAETQPQTEPAAPLLRIEANGRIFLADFMDNSSAEALKEKLQAGSVTLEMHDYGGFEKVGDLPFTLPRNDSSITTAPGDVILYLGSQLTIYYDTNTWSFTRVAKIRGADSTLKAQLGDGNVTVTLSLQPSA